MKIKVRGKVLEASGGGLIEGDLELKIKVNKKDWKKWAETKKLAGDIKTPFSNLEGKKVDIRFESEAVR